MLSGEGDSKLLLKSVIIDGWQYCLFLIDYSYM